MSGRIERTRAEDLQPPTRREKARAWVNKWKDLIIFVTACTAALVAFVTAAFVYDFSRQRAEDQRVVRVIAEEQARNARAQAEQAKATAAAAKLTCERTRRYAPYVIKDYRARKVLPAPLIADYERTVPKVCPK